MINLTSLKIGLVLLLGSIFLPWVQPAAAQTTINIKPPSDVPPTIGPLISSGIQAVIVIAGLITFVYLVWGGIEWLTSGGDKEKYESARGRITAAVIGLVIVIAAWAVMSLIGNFLGINWSNMTIKSWRDFSGGTGGVVGPND